MGSGWGLRSSSLLSFYLVEMALCCSFEGVILFQPECTDIPKDSYQYSDPGPIIIASFFL